MHVTAGTYDKASGLMDLRGMADVTYSWSAVSTTLIPRTAGGCYTGYWTYNETSRVNVKQGFTGSYAGRRQVVMSSRSGGNLHVGYYPGSYSTDLNTLPNGSAQRYQQDQTMFEEDFDCVAPPVGCSPSVEQTHCGIDSARESTTVFTNSSVPFPDFYTSTPPKIPVRLDRKGHLTGSATYPLTWDTSGGNAAPIPVTLEVTVDVLFSEGLIADPGGPYVVSRGNTVTLDASRSKTTDGVAITSYQWAWAADSDCIQPKNSPTVPASASTRSIVPLCGLKLTLTVKDAKRRTAQGITYVIVRKRDGDFAATPVSHEPSSYGIPATAGGDSPPNVNGYVAGVNLPRCPNLGMMIDDPWICPAPVFSEWGGTWLGNGYEIAQVTDPRGPFDGYFWVSSTSLAVDRKAYLNAYLGPGGPLPAGATINFYDENKLVDFPVDDFLASTIAHEGYGLSTSPLGGHTGAAVYALKRTADSGMPIDPRQRVEEQFGPVRTDVQRAADALIKDSELELCNATKDPLPVIWFGSIMLWNPSTSAWTAAQRPVGGQGATNCAQ
jgi:hypothetical protein